VWINSLTQKITKEKPLQPVNPFCTGAGGTQFEILVAVSFMVDLLRQEMARGLSDGIVQEVDLQQRNLGHPIDDIIVMARTAIGHCSLSLQVKHSLVWGENSLFTETISNAWREFSKRTFKQNHDKIGIVIGEESNKGSLRADVPELLRWAATSSDPNSFYQKAEGFAGKRSALAVLERTVSKNLGYKIDSDSVWRFLAHLLIIPFDFESRAGRDSISCWNRLLGVLDRRDVRHAKTLFDIFTAMALEYAPNAGTISWQTLTDRIQRQVDFRIPLLDQGGPSILDLIALQVDNRVAAEKNSKKYIPNIFMEVGKAKDYARLFCHPALFIQAQEDDIRRLARFPYLNRGLIKSGLAPVDISIPSKRIVSGKFGRVTDDLAELHSILGALASRLAPIADNPMAASPDIPSDRREYLDQNHPYLQQSAYSSLHFEIRDIRERLSVSASRVLLIVSRAGQGKTNFVCDLIERVLVPREIPCVLFTGRELRKIGKGELCTYIARSILRGNAQAAIDTILSALDAEAKRRDVPAIFIIDALNEHDDLAVFASELISLVEVGIAYSNIRFLLTCRTEYFDLRFSQLTRASFSHQVYLQREIHEQMEKVQKERLLKAYFRSFGVRCSLSEDVKKKLCDDPLLLRFFCEAYGNDAQICPPIVITLCKDALFRKYLQKKLASITESRSMETGFIVGSNHPYKSVLRTILDWMLSNRQFANIPSTAFAESDLRPLADIIDEDILLRRDLPDDRGVLESADQFVSFTFDECRDFLLADHILASVFHRDRTTFERLVCELTTPNCTVSEGLSNYLFFGVRYPGNEQALSFIQGQPWYDRIFIPAIFEVPDSLVTATDLSRVREIVTARDYRMATIVSQLIVRYNLESNKNLNILLFFDALATLSAPEAQSVLDATFGRRSRLDRAYYPLQMLIADLRSLILCPGVPWSDHFSHLARLLLLLWNVRDESRSYPARQLFREFEAANSTIASKVRREHLLSDSVGFKENTTVAAGIWR
jgi:hypothetical protein